MRDAVSARRERVAGEQQRLRERAEKACAPAPAEAEAADGADDAPPPKQVRPWPAVGSRISVFWSGDVKEGDESHAWHEGDVVAEEPRSVAEVAKGAPTRFRVRYDDGFESTHDLTTDAPHAYPYKLVRPPRWRLSRAADWLQRRLGATGRGPLIALLVAALVMAVPPLMMFAAMARGS